MKVYVGTSDKYIHLIEIYQFLFNKFWGNGYEVVVLGYQEPQFKLDDNFTFHSLGVSRNNPSEWGTDLKRYFEGIDDKFFIFMLEDMFPANPVNFDLLNDIINYLDDNIGRFNITNTHDRCRYLDTVEDGKLNGYTLLKCTPTSNYRISTIPSIWNRQYFLRYLKSEMSPWEFEVDGSNEAKEDGFRILGIKDTYALDSTLSVRRGNLSIDLDFSVCDNPSDSVSEEVLNEMREKNII